ncbi:MAG TPA: M24 family metallopeptidase [Candidatus Methanoperedens sp.]
MNRLEQLRSFLINRNFGAIILTKPANIAAFFRGIQVSLGFRQEPPGRIAICVTQESFALLGNRTEVIRIAEDELSWLQKLTLRPFRWDEWDLKISVKKYLSSEGIMRVCDDIGVFGENVGTALEKMYYPLNDQEIKNLKKLAKDTASIVEAVARNLNPGTTEVQVAGELAGRLVSAGIWPEFIMVAADERIIRFHHSISKEIPIKKIALLSVTVHSRGLYTSLTRLVSIGIATPAWRQYQDTCNRIDAKAIMQSKPGVSVGEIFRAIKQSYEDEGYPDEWEEHHQGGPAGFYGRDYKATENESRCLIERQPIVWNPTVRGAKSEDTILTARKGNFPEIITETGDWVYYNDEIDGIKIRRPAILEK